MYPEADIAVVQLSLQPELGPRHHYRLGRALGALADEGILLVGSGRRAAARGLGARLGPLVPPGAVGAARARARGHSSS
jgi:hypothetical protein